MSDNKFLKRLFQAYYKERQKNIPIVNLFEHREFGFIPWEKQIMIRHMGFNNPENFKKYLIENGPKHVYSSGSLYLLPENPEMKKKKYQGCDLLIDIDVDHFYTQCKEKHDFWFCKECNASGKGMIEKCPKCHKARIKTLTWICEECLNIAKKEIVKLIDDFLIPDFGIKENEIFIAFSGHRGYHLKIENDKIRLLSSEERREIVNYLTGHGISFEILGLIERGGIIHGLSKGNIGWPNKIVIKLEEILRKSKMELQNFLLDKRKFNFNQKLITSFLNSKDDLLEIISKNDKNIWAIEGFTLNRWKHFLSAIVGEIGAEIDEPVSIDVHRLIRYPGSLHGKTGFKVMELSIEDIEDFNPLNENNEKLDPITFQSKNLQKIEITEPIIPGTKIKGEIYGPYTRGEIIEIPHHVAVFLLCKNVAKTI
ncbi:MAG: DNA primase small subunit domain-containing protein [Promethearchaeota archaeon]